MGGEGGGGVGHGEGGGRGEGGGGVEHGELVIVGVTEEETPEGLAEAVNDPGELMRPGL